MQIPFKVELLKDQLALPQLGHAFFGLDDWLRAFFYPLDQLGHSLLKWFLRLEPKLLFNLADIGKTVSDIPDPVAVQNFRFNLFPQYFCQ
jgi:hypothetical protein